MPADDEAPNEGPKTPSLNLSMIANNRDMNDTVVSHFQPDDAASQFFRAAEEVHFLNLLKIEIVEIADNRRPPIAAEHRSRRQRHDDTSGSEERAARRTTTHRKRS